MRTLSKLVFAVLLTIGTASVQAHGGMQAQAEFHDAQGQTVGSATFVEGSSGVQITVEVNNLPPGNHGVHIHAVGQCDAPEFKAAGGHFNPENKQHGLENAAGPHAGDLPNLTVGEDGRGRLTYTSNRVTLSEGPNSLFDADGSALVVHAGPDDNKTDPAGDSGARIACGVIGAVEASLPATGGTPSFIPWLALVLGALLLTGGLSLRRRSVGSSTVAVN